MKKYAAADTGPLIILYQIEVLDFLQELYDEIFIPEAVKHELLKGVSGYKILSRQWIKIKTVKNKEVLKILKYTSMKERQRLSNWQENLKQP